MVKIFSSMMAAMGKQLKQSVNVFHSLILYRRLPQKDYQLKAATSAVLLTFIVEAVNTVDGRALVVASEDKEVFGVFDLVCEEETDCFERLFAPIHVVAQEEVICFGWEAAVFKES
jgi:hypothetical protein